MLAWTDPEKPLDATRCGTSGALVTPRAPCEVLGDEDEAQARLEGQGDGYFREVPFRGGTRPPVPEP
jgi:hypothetical protein